MTIASVNAGTTSRADVPHTINHQGVVKVNGQPFDGTGHFKFALPFGWRAINRWDWYDWMLGEMYHGLSMTHETRSMSRFGLAFETSSAVGSVAIGRGVEVLESRMLSRPKAHAVEFLPTIKALCEAHQVEPTHIERVYVSAGPGSFTGLRMGVTATRMIALGAGARVVGVPTLEVIAQNALDADPQPSRVAVVLDAKRNRVYAAAFVRQGGAYVAMSEAIEADPLEFFSAQPHDCAALGEGVLYHRQAIERSNRRILLESLYRPRAETVYRLGFDRAERGEFSDPRTLIPTYIRPPEAEEVWERKQSHGRK